MNKYIKLKKLTEEEYNKHSKEYQKVGHQSIDYYNFKFYFKNYNAFKFKIESYKFGNNFKIYYINIPTPIMKYFPTTWYGFQIETDFEIKLKLLKKLL